ncbi:DUF2345 domain-containing protein [Azospira sp.]|uniref:DUF2345 domain-containing protein n=1 Tax=Azospira sp. TaxID=1872671 RepID=UPI00255DD7E3|nr:DUF2345 domain-containing protein [Azospira sp.]
MARNVLLFLLLAGLSACDAFGDRSVPDLPAIQAKLAFTCTHEAERLPPLPPEADILFAYAKEHITFACGGAYIKIAGGNIDIHCPATASFKAGDYKIEGPTSLAQAMNSWPDGKFDEGFVLQQENGKPVVNRKFEVIREDGTKLRGQTDAQGQTGLQKSLFLENVTVRILPENSQ